MSKIFFFDQCVT